MSSPGTPGTLLALSPKAGLPRSQDSAYKIHGSFLAGAHGEALQSTRQDPPLAPKSQTPRPHEMDNPGARGQGNWDLREKTQRLAETDGTGSFTQSEKEKKSECFIF